MRLTSFTDLQVWQRSMDLVVDVYRLTERLPKGEQHVLGTQTRRAAVSIPSNIAEGFCRRSTASYIHHLNIALGSEGELLTQLELARRLGLASDPEVCRCLEALSTVGKMLQALVSSLERLRRH